ncbi:MAG: hypothetical protein QM775_34935 [Pirellulales bacterium]
MAGGGAGLATFHFVLTARRGALQAHLLTQRADFGVELVLVLAGRGAGEAKMMTSGALEFALFLSALDALFAELGASPTLFNAFLADLPFGGGRRIDLHETEGGENQTETEQTTTSDVQNAHGKIL